MKKTLSTLAAAAAVALALLPGATFAATTQIAQVPLLNINGTGSVKPNLMLLFDNSGSMAWTYTPDHINSNICRKKIALEQGVQACEVGHPPFMASDFNRQYYNPAIRYQPPIKWDGTFYPEQTAGNTSNWTNVTSDAFNVMKTDLYGAPDDSINLVTGFPDIKWCDPNNSSSCRTNTASYSYPDNTFNSPVDITTSPYYYNIAVAEYCTDDKLTQCVSGTVGAAAPTGYPVPAKVRWCDSTKLTNCQAKRIGSFTYPKFSTPSGTQLSYGTLTIGASYSATSMAISQVTASSGSTVVVITNGTVTAPTGTDTPLKQQTMANAIAASIIARNPSGNDEYWACVRSPTGGVTPCSTFGITLPADNIVAILPVTCTDNAKNLSKCVPINGAITANPRAGYAITATSTAVTPVVTTAFLAVSGGPTSNSGTPRISSVTTGSSTLTTNVNPGNNASAATVASSIVTKIGTGGTVRAYAGGNAITVPCSQQPVTTVCLVNTSTSGTNITNVPGASGFNSMGSIAFTGTAAVKDQVPTTSTPLSTGTLAGSSFVRVNLVTGQTYPKAIGRVDCVAQSGVCTYAEEMTNFANWYSYYKTRLQMMKTSVGIAFAGLTSNYRVGLARLSAAAAGTAMEMKPADFTGTDRSSWYTKLYATGTSGSTPMRAALDNVGRMFSNLSPYEYAAGQEVVQYPCQQNFTIVTTDGYWNGTGTNRVTNNDNTEQVNRFCTKANGCLDIRPQSQPSLADVALHWYNGGSSDGTVSLRPALEPDMSKPGLVPAGAGENTHLHMRTYTLGLGMDGVMTYDTDYDTAPKVGGDFYNLITGVTTGCPWNGGNDYVWPDPKTSDGSSTVQERVDDLWHAAVNGHGRYFSANEPREVVDGLSAALAKMQVSEGAASAAATSTPNISQQDNDIFSDTFTTVKWYGEITNKKIDESTGVVGDKIIWSSSDTVGTKVQDSSDTRKIYMDDGNGALVQFKYANMTSTQKTWFDNKCSSLSQCTLLSTTDRAIVNSGNNLVNWLRGQQQYANDEIFRAYTIHTPTGGSAVPIVLGDIAGSKPAYLREPRKSYTDPTYEEFKKIVRAPTVFTAANDGMLHAFDAKTGEEMWSYVPRITMKKLWQLASTTYASNHIFTADGSPELADVQIGGQWRTILVAGLNAGGRGFYALDVTGGTADPRPLWELCADATVCAKNDPDLGLSFGNPQFGMWQGKWVVFLTSGYNNVPGVDNVNAGNTGYGYLYVVDVATGTILKKVSTNSGSLTTPSGLAKITAITDDPASDPVVRYVYGGDNLGQMWRFDTSDPASSAINVTKMGDAGPTQPITTRPDVTLCAVQQPTGGLEATRVVLFGTGRLLDVPDTTNTDVQSLYLVKDNGTSINLRGGGMVEQVLTVTSGATQTFSINPKPVDLRTQNGWFFDWKLNRGERMNLDPKIVSGVANVVTNIPSSSSSCSVGGTSNFYALDVCKGAGVSSNVVGGTLSNTSAAVGFIIIRLPKGELKMVTTTAKGEMLTKPIDELDAIGAHPVGWRRVKGD